MTIIGQGIAIPGRLEATDLTVRPGERVALVGPNGGGKTSFLRALAGVEDSLGTLTIDGEGLARSHPARRRAMLGFLPASRDLHWPIAVRDLIALGLTKADPSRVEGLLAQFELDVLSDRPSDQLSTGERARVLMARVLASRPALLLLDEPLSNLDPYWVLRFLDVIDAEAKRGAALVVALHDLSLLDRFDRVLLVADGRVKMDETPDLLMASPAFEQIFRVHRMGERFAITR